MKHLLLLASLGLALLQTSEAAASGSLRCGGKLIKEGDPAAYVLYLCGAPEHQVAQESLARARTPVGSRFVGIAVSEQWVYDRGWGRFPAVLVLMDGTVKRIDFLRYRSDKTTRAR